MRIHFDDKDNVQGFTIVKDSSHKHVCIRLVKEIPSAIESTIIGNIIIVLNGEYKSCNTKRLQNSVFIDFKTSAIKQFDWWGK